MLESIENALQIAILCSCAGLTAYRAIKTSEKAWVLLFFFLTSRLLGDVYYFVCLLYFGDTPEIAFVSDVSWVASYLFLILMIKLKQDPNLNQNGRRSRPATADDLSVDKKKPWTIRRFIPWLGFVFAFGMVPIYNQWANPVTNIAYAALTGYILYEVIRGMLRRERNWLNQIIFLFILCEYGTWTSSSFPDYPWLDYVYYGFDTLMTFTFPFFLPIVRRELIEGGAVMSKT